jgi:tetraacyldisaccharide 4'-kinase
MPDYLWASSESRARKLALAPLLPLEAVYRAGAWLHRRAWESRWLRPVRLPVRVVSVGNLAVGGSAKTPLVAWLARSLHGRGRKVAVLTRGVGGRRLSRVNVVSDGERMLLGPGEVGDEAVWLAGAARGVPVLAGKNRTALGHRALALFGAEILVLDDGFQHHRLVRDLDLVCIDDRLGLGNGHVLPRGPLRESPAVLRHAHALLLTRADAHPKPPPGAGRFPAGVPVFRVGLVARGLRDLASGALEPVERLAGERVGLLAAIARPDRLRGVLEEQGAEVVAMRVFADHHLYRRDEIEALAAKLTWVTTAKDAVKIPAAWVRARRILALDETVRAEDAPPLLEWVSRRLDAPRRPT